MKKISTISLLLLLMLLFNSCAAKNVTAAKGEKTKASTDQTYTIKFEYFYRGFAAIHDNNEIETYPKETLIIETDEDWHDFMDKYVPGIPYITPVDFSKDCLVFSPIFPAKPTYTCAGDIKTFTVNENKLEPVYVDNGTIGISNGIYAQNIDNIVHCFVNIVKIDKQYIPKNVKNIYRKNK